MVGVVERMVAPAVHRQLYDARRDTFYDKPLARGWSHLLAFVAAVVLGGVVISRVSGVAATVSMAVYLASVAGLFGASALYHRGRWTVAAERRLQRLDHVMIVLLIAGTATPPLALSAPAPVRVVGLTILWALAAAAIALRLLWMAAPEKFAGSIYLALGWVAGAAVPVVWVENGVAPAVLLLAGGLLYTVGALCYHFRVPQLRPAIFGYHEAFHGYVILAAACQYVAIVCFVS
jgi:hemolysin III